jgi:hypothetical protein
LQSFNRTLDLAPGTWNDLEISVIGDRYTVTLNGVQTTDFTNGDAKRGQSPAANAASGFIGLQAHSGRVGFRNIRVKSLVAAPLSQIASMPDAGRATATTGR